MIVIQIILFILIIFFIFYLPGRFLLRLVADSLYPPAVVISLSLVLGISVFLIGTYCLSWMRIETAYYLFPITATLFELKRTLSDGKKIRLRSFALLPLMIISIGTIAMACLMWQSGSKDSSGGLMFFGVNSVDAIWHLSLIGNLIYNFPPTHPGLAGEPLRGYNFFYDFLLAGIYKIYPFSIPDLFFRYFPVFIGILYGLSLMMVAWFYKMSKMTTNIFLILGYFSQSIGITVFHWLRIPYHSPIVQPIANIVDPSVILSVILVFSTLPLLFGKKKKGMYLVVPILAVLPMVKIYTAFLAFAGICILVAVMIVRRRGFSYALVAVLSALLAAIIYLPINFGAGSLIFSPLLLYKHYMEGGMVLPDYQWILKYQVFELHGNLIRLAMLYGIAVGLFFLPSLGIRLFSLALLPNLLKKSFYTPQNIFLGTMIIVAFLTPSLFIQSVAVFVTVQFIWLAYFFLLIPTAFGFTGVLKKMPKYAMVVSCLVLALLHIPETLTLFSTYSINPLTIRKDFVQTAREIEKNVRPEESVLVLNEPGKLVEVQQGMSVVPLVSALGHRSVYYEPEVLEFQSTQSEVAKRKERISVLHSILSVCGPGAALALANTLRDTGNSHLLTVSEYPCLNTLPNIRKISSSGPYALYALTK